MPAPCGPRWTSGPSFRTVGHTNPGLRVSDAERTAVADRLAKHYGDGRLDEAEFNERLDRAMKAKTQADLNGLFDDLPETGGADGGVAGTGPAPPVRPRRRYPYHRFLILVLIVIAATAIGHAVIHWYFPWLLIGLLAFLWLRRGSWPRR
jgi:uncharacterized protein DUF1707